MDLTFGGPFNTFSVYKFYSRNGIIGFLYLEHIDQ